MARATRWLPPSLSVAATWLTVFFMTRCVIGFGGSCDSNGGRVRAMRFAAVMIALGSAFVLDDPTGDATAHLPGPLWLRRAIRIALVVPVLALGWVVSIPLALRTAPPGTRLPAGALTLEMAAIVSLVLASAALAGRLASDRIGGIAAGPTLLVLLVTSFFLPARHSLFVDSQLDPPWRHSHHLWQVLLGAGILGLVALSVDPVRLGYAGRRPRRRSGELKMAGAHEASG